MLAEPERELIGRRCEAVLRRNWREGTRARDGQPFAFELDRSLAHGKEAGKRLDESRFTRAVRADHGQDAAFLERDVDAFKDVARAIAGVEC